MAKTKAFEIAELIRVFKYNTATDEIETDKRTKDKNTKRGDANKNLD